MYTLALQREFIARHYLVGGDWGAENDPHSHPYRVEVQLSAETLDAHGYLVDLDDLESVLDHCVGRYRDRMLNELPEFAQTNPSIEHLAKCFFDRFVERLDRGRFAVVQVKIWENRSAWAAYRESSG